MKLLVAGWALSGKDTVCEHFKAVLGLTFKSSSYLCIELFLFNQMQEKFGFKTVDEAYNYRRSPEVRQWLYKKISEINKDDKTTIARAIFDKYDMYSGLRDYEELEECKKKWPDMLVIWVDAEGRTPPEPKESCTVVKEQAHIIIENKGNIEELSDKLNRFCDFVGSFSDDE